MKWGKHDMAAIFKTFSIMLRLLHSSLKVMTKSKTKFYLRPFVNPILSKHKIYLNFMTKNSTFKIFILDLRQNLDLRPFMNLGPGTDFTKGFSPVSDSNLRLLSQIIGTFYLSPWAKSLRISQKVSVSALADHWLKC